MERMAHGIMPATSHLEDYRALWAPWSYARRPLASGPNQPETKEFAGARIPAPDWRETHGRHCLARSMAAPGGYVARASTTPAHPERPYLPLRCDPPRAFTTSISHHRESWLGTTRAW